MRWSNLQACIDQCFASKINIKPAENQFWACERRLRHNKNMNQYYRDGYHNHHLSYLIPHATKASFWLVFVCDDSDICMAVMCKCTLKLRKNCLSFWNSKPNVNHFNKMLLWAISKIKNLQIAWQMNEIYMR